MNEARARRDLVRYSAAMYAAGWVANHDGNLSARFGEDRIVCTPTAFSKADIGAEDLVVVDREGRKLSGAHSPFSELVLHRCVYAARPDVQAVVHAHSPMATAYGAAGVPPPHPFLPEAVVSLGAELPLVALTAPGEAAVNALRPHVRRCDALLVAGNGAWAWGPDLETAYLRLELLEHLCRIAWNATPLGGVQRLPEEMIRSLVERRRRGGLAAPEEGSPPGTPDLVARATERVLAALPNADPAIAAALAEKLARTSARG